MSTNESNQDALKIIEKIQNELKEIELTCIEYTTRKKLSRLLDYIEQETTNNRTMFMEMLLDKIKITKRLNPEINTNLYILYRNLMNNKISIEDAQNIYEMYAKETLV